MMPSDRNAAAVEAVAATSSEALLKRRVAELEAENRSLRSEIRSGRDLTKRAFGGSDVQSRLFDESLRATTAAHRSTKKFQSARRAFVAARQEVEMLRMSAHDPVAVSDYAAACIDAAEDSATYSLLADSAAGHSRRRSASGASLLGGSSSSAKKPSGGFGWEALRRAMSFNTRNQLEHRLGAPGGADAALAMPDMESAEAYLKARINRSEHLKVPLEHARAAAFATGKDAYGSVATTLGELEYIFADATKPGGGLLACPKADFNKASKLLMSQIALKLKSLRRAVDTTCTDILDAEHERAKARRSRLVDGATQLTREDVIFIDNVANLHAGGSGRGATATQQNAVAETSAKEWEQRYRALESRCCSLERSLGQQKAVAKTAKEQHVSVVAGEQDKLASMADAVFRLHDAAYRAVHAVFKHRFKWCPACPNNFVDVRRTPSQRRDPATDEVTTLWRTTHVVEIAEASRKDAQLLATFAEYFINDNLFGADVLHASKQQQQQQQQQSRRGTIPIAGSSTGVRDGFVAFDDNDAADKENGGDPGVKARPKSAAAAPSSARGFRRMEQWHQQQSAKWNERRASASSSAALPPNVKLDDHTPIKAVVGTGAHAATALTPRAVVQTMSLTPTEPALPMPPMARHAGDLDGGASVREPFRRRHSSVY